MALGRWAIHLPDGLHWRVWDDAHVLYHEASGETHLLGEFDAAALRRLTESPSNPRDLVCWLGEAFSVEEDDDLYFYVDELLERFAALGLIRWTRRTP